MILEAVFVSVCICVHAFTFISTESFKFFHVQNIRLPADWVAMVTDDGAATDRQGKGDAFR